MQVIKQNNHKAAFTLVEMMAVVVIIMIVVGLGIPTLGRVTTVNLKAGSRKIMNIMRLTYNKAILTKNVYRVAMDFDQKTYWVEEQREVPAEDSEQDNQKEVAMIEVFEKTSFFLAKPGKLPSGVSFDSIESANKISSTTDGQGYVYFYPEGGSSGGDVILKNSEENIIKINIHPITGRVKAAKDEQ